MNKSLNVFLSVLLCFVLCAGVLTSLYTTDDSASQHYQTEYTSSIPTGIDAPSVSFGVGANGDVLAVPMSSRRSSREQYLQPSRRSTGVADLQGFARSANSKGMLSLPSLQGGDGGRLFTHMSSSQTMKSFGGGSNAAGVSMSGGVVSTNNLTTSSPNNLITSSPTSLLALSPNNLITSSPTSLTTSGDIRAISGRRGAGPASGGFGNSWIEWLEDWYNGLGYTGGTFDNATGLWTVGVNNADLEAAYEAFLANWNYGLGNPPTLPQWYAWFLSNGGSHTANNGNIYNFTPVGDILPLLLFPLFYVFFLAVFCKFKRSETTISVNE